MTQTYDEKSNNMNRMLTKSLFVLVLCIALIGSVSAAAPESVSGLSNTSDCHSVTWRWSNPADDFNGTMIWRNGAFYTNLTNASATTEWSGLTSGGSYEIGIATFNLTGETNTSTVNQTVILETCPQPVSCTTSGIVGALTLIGVMLIGAGAILVIVPFATLGGGMGRGGAAAAINPGSSMAGIIAICIGAVLLLISYAVLSPIFTVAGC